MTRTWDIFCSVVDNYGDIGVCWRLARQLVSELGQSVRLWVDNLQSFHNICPSLDPTLAAQHMGGVDVRHWCTAFPAILPADIVIEGFGAPLPVSYVHAMAARSPRPVWINLEYLSAENWVEGYHGLPSPQPRLPLVKHFFFPGFTPGTGGLLMENGLARTRDAFQNDADAVARFWHTLGVASGAGTALRASLFCYDNAALPDLVATWSSGSTPVLCVVPAGRPLAQLSSIVTRDLQPGSQFMQGQLTIQAISFLDVDRYDRLLWACDINFVRGEDSFLRAQLAARPMVWQAYPQSQDAHMTKVAAFLERYSRGMDTATAKSVHAFDRAWNLQSAEAGRCWGEFLARRAQVAAHAQVWASGLAQSGSLAIKLAEFCQDRLE
jgi:uncharacterized repeat protein (TIGR03837 family)